MSGKFWVTDPNAYLEPRGEGVPGGTKDRAKTILEVLHDTVQKHGSQPALALKRKVEAKDGSLGEDGKKSSKISFFLCSNIYFIILK